MSNEELIQRGFAVCPHCGQAVAVDKTSGLPPSEAAMMVCDCPEARRFRLRRERTERSDAIIDELFGKDCEEAIEATAIPEEAVWLLKGAAVMAIDGIITGISVQCGGICKASIKCKGDGDLKIERKEGRSYSREE